MEHTAFVLANPTLSQKKGEYSAKSDSCVGVAAFTVHPEISRVVMVETLYP